MGSKTSKAKRPTSAETETIIIPVGPRIPQDIIDEILGRLALSSGFELTKSLETPLRSCSLVSKLWVPSCRRYLFYTIRFTARDMAKWLETFPVPKESPAHYVRKLRLSFGGCHDVPREFFKHTQWFVNVERMVLEGYEFNHPFKMPLFTRLPQSVTSLEIFALRIDLVRVWDVMAQLPNLDDLRLRGDVAEDGKLWPGLGTALKAKFGGKLELYGEHTDEGVVDILLEVPTGLHFTEVYVCADRKSLLSTVRLAEACGEILMKLSYAGHSSDNNNKAVEWSFDFSKFQSLREVTFSTSCYYSGDLHWINMALSTLKPATTPHLSKICLIFSAPMYSRYPYSGSAKLEEFGNDVQGVVDEFVRIEREHEGAADLIVFRDREHRLLDRRNVLQRWIR